MPAIFRFVFCAALIWVSAIAAVPSARAQASLYETDIAVSDRLPETTSRAIVDAFRQVLVRVTGTVETLDNPSLQAPIANAEKYLVQYSYRAQPQLPLPKSLQRGSDLYLNARFQPGLVESLLRGAAAPLLPANRPSTQVWLMLETANGSALLKPSDADGFAAELRYSAASRAVPLSWPVDDLEDMVNMPPQRIRAMDVDAARNASARYGADSVIVGRVVALGSGGWIAEWRQALPDGVSWHQHRADSGLEIAKAIADSVAEGVALAFAVRANPEAAESTEIAISNIRSLADYRLSRRKLESLASVQRVQPAAIIDDSVRFRVFGTAGIAAVTQELSLVRELEAEAAEGDESEAAGLRYRWSPAP